MKKVLVVSSYAPPNRGGSPVYLGRLLRFFPKGSYAIFTKELGAFSGDFKSGVWMPVNYHFLYQPEALHGSDLEQSKLMVNKTVAHSTLNKGGMGTRLNRIKRSQFLELILFPFRIYKITHQAKLVLSQEHSDLILLTSDDGYYFISGFLLSVLTRKPYIVVLWDIYKGNKFPFFKNIIANVMEKPILTHAEKVFVTSEMVRDGLAQKYGIKPIILRHSTYPFKHTQQKLNKNKVILYSGNIDWPQIDGLRILTKVINKMDGVKLRILCPSSPSYLKSLGLAGNNVEIAASKVDAVPQQINQADALYLPLSVIKAKESLIKTALPYKMAEYISSGKPILVHSPPDSFLSQYAENKGFGLVVSDMSELSLKKALTNILYDKSLRETLSRNTKKLFTQNHDIRMIGPNFAKYFR